MSHWIYWLQLFWGAETPSPLPFFPALTWLGADQVASWVFTIYFMNQHLMVFRIKALIEAIMLHFLHMLGMNPFWVL